MGEVHDLGPVRWLAQGRMFLNAWIAAPGPGDLTKVCEAQLSAHRAHGSLGVITILRPDALPRMDDATRRASADARRLLDHTFASSAFLIDQEGFLAAFARSILSGVHLMMPADHPTKVFRDSLLAAEWTASHVGGVTSGEVASLIQHLRSSTW